MRFCGWLFAMARLWLTCDRKVLYGTKTTERDIVVDGGAFDTGQLFNFFQ